MSTATPPAALATYGRSRRMAGQFSTKLGNSLLSPVLRFPSAVNVLEKPPRSVTVSPISQELLKGNTRESRQDKAHGNTTAG